MRGMIRVRHVLAVGLVVGVLTWGGLRMWTGAGHRLPDAGPAAAIALLVLAIGVVVAGRPVRAWRRGDRSRTISPIWMARLVAAAQAAALGGGVLGGWYLGQLSVVLPDLDVPSVGARLVPLAAAVVASALLTVAGLWVQRICRIDDSER